ncbi:pilus assembly protein CpaB [Paucimonas lemoignei]|uniref:Pilus assembly protein CpaB n=1 Tax=Paucimonas lemoignei TaxID=29443 RepID=A0A4R3HW88_PAULE|nr:Flp pilus assembly protein CpaB [Paucimonas lemoignei]TCS37546.1 pilus assembly protein CpaB [Paucimonas lemoignei]
MKIQRPNIKINKTWLMLIVAIVLSLLTAWLTLQYLRFKEQSLEAEIAARSQKDLGETVAVVVPTKHMPPGALLEESMVAARNVPADFVYEDTIRVSEFDAYKGQALLHQVERGKPLRRSDVREVFSDFADTLKAGKRAITINVDEINSVSHMIEPGNLVDLLLVLPGSEGSNHQTVVPFLDQVKVLATGQKVTQDDPAAGNGQPRRVTYSNFTLEVTPTQAARLSLATELGKVRAVLRNEKDTQSVDFETVTAENILEEVRERERRVALSKPSSKTGYVEYFIGGKGGSEAVAPVINVPLPAGALPSMPGGAPAATQTVTAQPALPQNLTELIKLSNANASAKAATTK